MAWPFMIPRIGFEKVVVSLKVNVQIVDDDDDSARDIGKGRIKLVTSTVKHIHRFIDEEVIMKLKLHKLNFAFHRKRYRTGGYERRVALLVAN